MTVPKNDTPLEMEPIPPRYAWLRRLAVAVMLWLGFIVLLRIGWGNYAEARWHRMVADFRTEGGPVFASEFPTVQESESAGAALLSAFHIRVFPVAGQPNIEELPFDSALADDYPAEIQREWQANKKILAAIRQTRATHRPRWPTPPDWPSVTAFGLSSLRSMAKLCCAATILEARQADTAAAMEHLEDALWLGEIASARGTQLGHLVAIALDDLLLHSVEAILPYMTRPEGIESTRQELTNIEHVICRLMNRQSRAAAWEYAVRTERAVIIDLVQRLCDGLETIGGVWSGPEPLSPALARLLFTPTWKTQAARELNRTTEQARRSPVAFAERTPFVASKSRALEFKLNLDPAAYLLNPAQVGNLDRVWQFSRSAQVRRELAGVALAIRWFELEQGRLPNTLGELLPDFLAELPTDLLDPEGRPLRFGVVEGALSVYSIGTPDDRSFPVLIVYFDRGCRNRYYPRSFSPAALASAPSSPKVDQNPDNVGDADPE